MRLARGGRRRGARRRSTCVPHRSTVPLPRRSVGPGAASECPHPRPQVFNGRPDAPGERCRPVGRRQRPPAAAAARRAPVGRARCSHQQQPRPAKIQLQAAQRRRGGGPCATRTPQGAVGPGARPPARVGGARHRLSGSSGTVGTCQLSGRVRESQRCRLLICRENVSSVSSHTRLNRTNQVPGAGTTGGGHRGRRGAETTKSATCWYIREKVSSAFCVCFRGIRARHPDGRARGAQRTWLMRQRCRAVALDA